MKTEYAVAPIERRFRISAYLYSIGLTLISLTAILVIYEHHGRSLLGWVWLVYFILTAISLASERRNLPTRYEVGDDSVAIVTRAGTKTLPLAEITGLRRPEEKEFKHLCGLSRRLLSYLGENYAPAVGKVYVSVTNKNQAVVLSGKEMYVISPKDPESFIADVEGHTGRMKV